MFGTKDRSTRHAVVAASKEAKGLSTRDVLADADGRVGEVRHRLLFERTEAITMSQEDVCSSRHSVLLAVLDTHGRGLFDDRSLQTEADPLDQVIDVEGLEVDGIERSHSDLGHTLGPEGLINQHWVNDGGNSGSDTRGSGSCSSMMDRHLALWKEPLVRSSFDDQQELRHLKIRKFVPS